MPIYEYHCLECGHSKDVLQKVTDAPLVDCPECGVSKFEKKISAPGFQLKGTGWYETDFKNKSTDPSAASGATTTKTAAKTSGEPAAPTSTSDSSGNSTASAA